MQNAFGLSRYRLKVSAAVVLQGGNEGGTASFSSFKAKGFFDAKNVK